MSTSSFSSFTSVARPKEVVAADLLRMASEALFAMHMLQLVSVVKMRDVASARGASLKATIPGIVLFAHMLLTCGLLCTRIMSGHFPLAEWAAHYEKLTMMASKESMGGGSSPSALDIAVHLMANVPAIFEGLMLVFDAVSWVTLAALLGRSLFMSSPGTTPTPEQVQQQSEEAAAAAEVDKRPKWLAAAPLFVSSLLLASWVGAVLDVEGVKVADLLSSGSSMTQESLMPLAKALATNLHRHIGIAGLLSTILWATQVSCVHACVSFYLNWGGCYLRSLCSISCPFLLQQRVDCSRAHQ
jgi:hypothetical protein